MKKENGESFNNINDMGLDDLGRPCKDLYRMNLCFEIARASLDPSTKHGCLAIGSYGNFLSSGYNSPPQHSNDKNIPLTRPEKYDYFEHSERNCIYMAAREGIPLHDSIFYITGFPCIDCLRAIIQVGAVKIVYGPYNSVLTSSEDYLLKYPIILKGQPLVIERFKYDKGLYEFNSRVKKIIEEREISDIIFQWNVLGGIVEK